MCRRMFEWPIRVYIEDTDAGGIVYYVNYFKFIERARTEFLRGMGYDKAAMFDNDTMFVVRAADAHYHRPAKLDDELVVQTHITNIKGASLRMSQNIFRKDELLVSAQVELASVNVTSMKPVRLSKAMLDAMRV